MSYDLYLFRPVDGEDPVETLERMDEQQESAGADPELLQRNRRIADRLRDLNDGYDEGELNYEVLAEQDGISVAEARAKHRHIELLEEGGLQILLYDHQAAINFPYWESLDPAHLWAEIASAAEVITAETGWSLYDPQLDRFVDPAADGDAFREAFDYGRDSLQRIVAEQEGSQAAPKRSLWDRLRGRQ